ncbi:hypothetical protein AA103196_2972 [Ameyamaea chiangmaiensis NBRC 103196]|nr:hypothetical protein AA103196_2972 [Ameyamaea chiangmaiensis NBRC 103196]
MRHQPQAQTQGAGQIERAFVADFDGQHASWRMGRRRSFHGRDTLRHGRDGADKAAWGAPPVAADAAKSNLQPRSSPARRTGHRQGSHVRTERTMSGGGL